MQFCLPSEKNLQEYFEIHVNKPRIFIKNLVGANSRQIYLAPNYGAFSPCNIKELVLHYKQVL